MYITTSRLEIATTSTNCVSEAERSYRANHEESAVLITVPQRKAQYHNKNRIRWIDAKRMALNASSCADTAEVRKWLKFLKVQCISLRMTSGWVAVRRDLATKIKIAKNKSLAIDFNNVVEIDDSRKVEIKKSEPKSDVEIVYEAMKDAIAFSKWEFLRLALIDREQYKADAWSMLSDTEKHQLEGIVPPEIRGLKLSKKEGKIADFKEDPEGGIFWVWIDRNVEPTLLSGTSVSKYYKGREYQWNRKPG